MSGFSTHLANGLINYALRQQAFTQPPGTYLALFVADPTDDNITANEVSAGWYARQEVASWAAPSTGVTSNSNPIAFPAVTVSAVSVTHWALYDAATTGNLLASGAFTTPISLSVNDVLTVDAGDLDIVFV